jgi:rhodanese-related sulfurtransferase
LSREYELTSIIMEGCDEPWRSACMPRADARRFHHQDTIKTKRKSAMNTLTVDSLKQMQDQNQDFLLINTLDEENFPSTRIPGSVNIPQASDEFVERVEREAGSKEKKIVVYCASEECQSSTKAAQKLETAGFSNVFDFEAGAKGWQEAGQKLTVG